jgi:hypothetical protein
MLAAVRALVSDDVKTQTMGSDSVPMEIEGVGDVVVGVGVEDGSVWKGTAIRVEVPGVGKAPSAVWVAKILAAITVACASSLACEGPQAAKTALINRQAASNAFLFISMTSL